jgi:hypothetical protein
MGRGGGRRGKKTLRKRYVFRTFAATFWQFTIAANNFFNCFQSGCCLGAAKAKNTILLKRGKMINFGPTNLDPFNLATVK